MLLLLLCIVVHVFFVRTYKFAIPSPHPSFLFLIYINNNTSNCICRNLRFPSYLSNSLPLRFLSTPQGNCLFILTKKIKALKINIYKKNLTAISATLALFFLLLFNWKGIRSRRRKKKGRKENLVKPWCEKIRNSRILHHNNVIRS